MGDNMSVVDTVQYKGEDEKYEIRLALTTRSSGLKQQNGNMQFISDKVELRREKIRSLAFLLGALDDMHKEDFISIVKCDKDKKLEQLVLDNIQSISERYMMQPDFTIYNATIEAMTQIVFENKDAQDYLDGIVEKLCPKLYSKKDTCIQTTRRVIEYIANQAISPKNRKKAKEERCFCASEEMIAILYYLIIWKTSNDMDDKNVELLTKFIKGIEIPIGKFSTARRTDTSLDWLADILNLSTEKLMDDKLFLKYQENCLKKAAIWMHDVIDKDEFLCLGSVEDYEGFFEKEKYRDFFVTVFSEMLLNLQNIKDKEDAEASDFGVNPMSVLLNSLAEIKWYPKCIGGGNFYAAFNVSLASVAASYAISSFDGENVEEELERTNMIRKSGINNPERFVCDLFTAFVLQLISLEYKKKDYDVYSISIDVEKELMKENPHRSVFTDYISQKEDSIALKDKEIAQLKKNLQIFHQKQQDEEKEINKKIKPLEDENRELQKENRKLKEELKTLKQKKEELDSMIEAYEQTIGKQEQFTESKHYLSDEELRNQKILFVGGRYELVRTLKNIMVNAKFVQTETDPVPDLAKIDKIIYFSNFINHSTYNKVFDKAKILNISYQFVHTQNYEQVWELLKRASN